MTTHAIPKRGGRVLLTEMPLPDAGLFVQLQTEDKLEKLEL